jgi:hypothetical protein
MLEQLRSFVATPMTILSQSPNDRFLRIVRARSDAERFPTV